MVTRLLVFSVCAAALLTSGCFTLTEFDNLQTTERETFALPFNEQGKLPRYDILFVVDRPTESNDVVWNVMGGVLLDSAEMPDLLEAGAINFSGPPGSIEPVELHIGVITSDLGAGFDGFPGCDVEGDDGILRTDALAPECDGLTDSNFIRVINGTVENMDASDLGTAVQCMIQSQLLRTTTCPIKQPLRAVQRALSSRVDHANDGFLQTEGGLAVVFISGEDDCSAEDLSVYDEYNFSPLHCLTQGVSCEQEGDFLTGCTESPTGALMQTAELATLLNNAKGADAVVISVLAGPYNANLGVELEQVPDLGLRIRPSCTTSDTNMKALPAVRLSMLKDHFADTSVFEEICSPESSHFFDGVAKKLAATAAFRCMPMVPVDTSDAPGMQADCVIRDVEHPDQVGLEHRYDPHPECRESGYEVTCWEMMPEATCTKGFKLVLQRAVGDDMEDHDIVVEAECEVHME